METERIDRKCHVCGKEVRTMKTSDQGWVSMCVNPDCDVKGKTFDRLAIFDFAITANIKEYDPVL
jgi:hypothetical protein